MKALCAGLVLAAVILGELGAAGMMTDEAQACESAHACSLRGHDYTPAYPEPRYDLIRMPSPAYYGPKTALAVVLGAALAAAAVGFFWAVINHYKEKFMAEQDAFHEQVSKLVETHEQVVEGHKARAEEAEAKRDEAVSDKEEIISFARDVHQTHERAEALREQARNSVAGAVDRLKQAIDKKSSA